MPPRCCRDDGENERLRALVEGEELGGLVTSDHSEGDRSGEVTHAVQPESVSEKAGSRGTRPEGFEPSTSASGGR